IRYSNTTAENHGVLPNTLDSKEKLRVMICHEFDSSRTLKTWVRCVNCLLDNATNLDKHSNCMNSI
ncbi:hypothetical protein MHBO_003814, partial [Bonamia ostreae]